jgi:hypothetical protein
MYVEVYPPDTLLSDPGHFVRVPIRVTHDVPDPVIDSIGAFVIPLCWWQTNSTAYCSLTDWWNNTDVYPFPTIDRSVFRHLDGDTNWMMALSERMDGSEWDTRILNLAGNTDQSGHFWLALFPIGTPDQRFWEGSRLLLATMTFKVEDSTTISVDSCHWPPTGHLGFIRSDATMYVPRHNLPYSFPVRLENLPEILSTSPGQNELNVPVTADISVVFNVDMDETTINDSTFVVNAWSTGLHQGIITYSSGTKTATLAPSEDFDEGEIVTVVLTTEIQSSQGVPLDSSYVWSFTTEANWHLCLPFGVCSR